MANALIEQGFEPASDISECDRSVLKSSSKAVRTEVAYNQVEIIIIFKYTQYLLAAIRWHGAITFISTI